MQEIRTKGFHPPWHIFPFTLGFNRSFVSVGSNLHSFEVEESTMLLDDIKRSLQLLYWEKYDINEITSHSSSHKLEETRPGDLQ